jgi:hypothetical protein
MTDADNPTDNTRMNPTVGEAGIPGEWRESREPLPE